jgi:hypothetical protein
MSNQLPPACDPSGPELRMPSPVAHLKEAVGGCRGGPVMFHAPHCLWHLCKQLRGDHFETFCEHVRFTGCWTFDIAEISAECRYAHHHAVQAMIGCAWPCCKCHNCVQD